MAHLMRRHGIALRDATALVTGASSGIGRALALRLAARGTRLVVSARRSALLEELAREIEAAGGHRPVVVAADLSAAGGAARLAAAARDALGPIDLVVSNAGASPIGGQSLLGDGLEARAAFETNLWTPLALAAALVPGMLEAGRGTIVHVSSTVQAVPIPLLGAYSASKAALSAATKALRHELRGTPIRVVEVVPGATDTGLRDVDALPWRSGPPRTLPPVAPAAMADAIVRRLERGDRRIVHPASSLLPLELPAVGRLIAAIASRRIDTDGALPAVRQAPT